MKWVSKGSISHLIGMCLCFGVDLDVEGQDDGILRLACGHRHTTKTPVSTHDL